MSDLPSLREMLENGVHFGHSASRWHPKMKPYIYGKRQNVHIINLEKTRDGLDSALKFVVEQVGHGKTVLFVGTNPQARELVKEAASKAGMPFVVQRWFGGWLTNFGVLKKNLKALDEMEKAVTEGKWTDLTKKEKLQKEEKMAKQVVFLEGVRSLNKLPDVILIANADKENIAITEANKLGIPVVALVDTDTNPKGVDYVIPANDNSVKSLHMLLDIFANAISEARQDYQKNLVVPVAKAEVIEPKKTKTLHKISQDGVTSEETVEASYEPEKVITEE
jgi:small subunit ribosomal protein S2